MLRPSHSSILVFILYLALYRLQDVLRGPVIFAEVLKIRRLEQVFVCDGRYVIFWQPFRFQTPVSLNPYLTRVKIELMDRLCGQITKRPRA